MSNTKFWKYYLSRVDNSFSIMFGNLTHFPTHYTTHTYSFIDPCLCNGQPVSGFLHIWLIFIVINLKSNIMALVLIFFIYKCMYICKHACGQRKRSNWAGIWTKKYCCVVYLIKRKSKETTAIITVASPFQDKIFHGSVKDAEINHFGDSFQKHHLLYCRREVT